jgi:hypothetical protein
VSFQGHRDDTYRLWFAENSALREGGMSFARTGRMNLARFRPSSRNPHKSVSNVEFNQVLDREQSQQLDTKIN